MSRDEERVLNFIKERLDQGRREYGPLELKDDKRDFLMELAEELADALVYIGAEMARRGRA
jgi:hypothetical protein